MPINAYEENRILNASPVELVQILYAAAVRSIRNARESLRAGDILSRSREISKVQVILLELTTSVDPGKGKDVAERLLALYDYMQSRLVEANAAQREEPLAEVDA